MPSRPSSDRVAERPPPRTGSYLFTSHLCMPTPAHPRSSPSRCGEQGEVDECERAREQGVDRSRLQRIVGERERVCVGFAQSLRRHASSYRTDSHSRLNLRTLSVICNMPGVSEMGIVGVCSVAMESSPVEWRRGPIDTRRSVSSFIQARVQNVELSLPDQPGQNGRKVCQSGVLEWKECRSRELR